MKLFTVKHFINAGAYISVNDVIIQNFGIFFLSEDEDTAKFHICIMGESHMDFRTQCAIMKLAGEGISLMTF